MVSESLQRIIGSSILEYNVQNYFKTFSDSQKRKILQHAPLSLINNSILSEHIELILEKDIIKNLNNKQFVSLMIRLYDMQKLESIELSLKVYDTQSLGISVSKTLISRNPEFFCNLLHIDLSTLNHNDAVSLLKMGNQFLFDNIDIKKYELSNSESFEIAKNFGFKRSILLQLSVDQFDGFDTREVIIQSNDEVMDILDLDQLSASNWRDILLYKPELRTHVDVSKFMDTNIIDFIELCVAANYGYEFILNLDLNEISGYGWELLLISKPDLFLPICDFDKLEYSNRLSILTQRPELSSKLLV